MSDFNHSVIHLIENMINVFQRKKGSKQISKRITRGRASASASEFEEELAKLIEKTYSRRRNYFR